MWIKVFFPEFLRGESDVEGPWWEGTCPRCPSVDGSPFTLLRGVALFNAFFVITLSQPEATHTIIYEKSEQMMTGALRMRWFLSKGGHTSEIISDLGCVNDVWIFKGLLLLPVQVWDHSSDELRSQKRRSKPHICTRGEACVMSSLTPQPWMEKLTCPFTDALSYLPPHSSKGGGVGGEVQARRATPNLETGEEGVPGPQGPSILLIPHSDNF